MNTGLPAFRTLILQTGGAAATLTLNRPDALNAIDVAMAEDLQRAAQWLETRADIRVVTLQGAGNALCAGGDISMFEGAACAVRASLMDLFTPLNDFLVRVARMDKVWLAQVHGIAAGAGLSLTLACDLAIAEAGTRFMTAYLAGRHARCRHDARSDAHRGTKAGAGPAAAARSVQRRGSAVLGPGHPSSTDRSAARTGGGLRGRHRRPCSAQHRRRQAAAAHGGAGHAGNPAQ